MGGLVVMLAVFSALFLFGFVGYLIGRTSRAGLDRGGVDVARLQQEHAAARNALEEVKQLARDHRDVDREPPRRLRRALASGRGRHLGAPGAAIQPESAGLP